MVLTYRALNKTYPMACLAIVDFAHENRLLFEAALDEFIGSKGIVVEVNSIRDKNRNNKLVGYSFVVQMNNSIGAIEPITIKDSTVYPRELYAWQDAIRQALRLVEDGLTSTVS